MSDKNGDLAGKVVLVTGGSSGIGRAACLAFASRGARVAVHAFQGVERARSVADAIAMAGGDAGVFIADLRTAAAASRLVSSIVEQFGRLDVLVNNAGDPLRRSAFVDVDEPLLDETLAVNFKSAFFLCREAAEPLTQSRGNIVNISTALTRRAGGGGNLHYACAKGAINVLTTGLAAEFGERGIRVNCVAPGVVDTELQQRLSDQARLAVSTGKQIIKRAGTPEEIAELIVFLASPAAAFITGQVVYADGG